MHVFGLDLKSRREDEREEPMLINLQSLSPTALTDAAELNLQELGTLWGHALGADFHNEEIICRNRLDIHLL